RAVAVSAASRPAMKIPMRFTKCPDLPSAGDENGRVRTSRAGLQEMPEAGLEPARLAARDFKSPASAISPLRPPGIVASRLRLSRRAGRVLISADLMLDYQDPRSREL